jgi:hypothetical protein
MSSVAIPEGYEAWLPRPISISCEASSISAETRRPCCKTTRDTHQNRECITTTHGFSHAAKDSLPSAWQKVVKH